jgi:tetrahydromethanopterin S-methyltransferase subunit F
MNRANIENIDKVFEEIKYKPCQKAWAKPYEVENQCCGLSALMIQEDNEFVNKIYGVSDFKVIAGFITDKIGLTTNYISGFVNGFDGYYSKMDDKDYITGREDGSAAWEKVKHLVEVKQ